MNAEARRTWWLLLLYRVLVGAALLGFWEWSSGRLIDPFWISSPTAVGMYFVKIVSSGELLRHTEITLYETLVGYVSGAVLGIAAGFALARYDTAARVLDPYIIAINGVPRIAIAPLFIVWFGIGVTSKIVLASTVVLFLCFMNTYAGIKGVDRDLTDIARVMGASQRQMIAKVVIPAAAPWIITGLKVSVPYALVGALVGEFMASSKGLGYMIQMETGLFNTTGALAGVLILMFIVIGFNAGLNRLEQRALRWRRGRRAGPGGDLM